jgi:hypothetical protein
MAFHTQFIKCVSEISDQGNADMKVHAVYVFSPTAILIGHKFGLNDVKIHTSKRVVLSYDKEAVLKVWGLDTAECLQTMPLHFPR